MKNTTPKGDTRDDLSLRIGWSIPQGPTELKVMGGSKTRPVVCFYSSIWYS